MLRSQNLFTDGERTSEQRFGFFVPALSVAESRPLIQRLGHIGMLRSQDLFAHRERTPVEFLRFVVFAFGSSKIGKMVKTVCNIGVVESLHLFSDSQGALHKSPGRLVATLRKVEFP